MTIAALLAGLFSGILGAMGLGGGAVLIIYLTLFTETEQLTAQGINLLFFIPTALLAVIIYAVKKKIKWRLTVKISLWGLLGTVLGMSLTSLLGGELTAKIFGGLLILMGLSEIFKRDAKNVAEKKKR
ncbi:MAG: sulfite exporter TauE/SafE family protein [Ruminococcaceae bacterium]|nr:sulfite exporter TauE/SafE family protein [Oscillospiraceae bacterium]